MEALVVDVDGVLRRWDPDEWAAAEARAGVPRGALYRAAFDKPALRSVVTGRTTDAQWREGTAERLSQAHDVPLESARDVVASWSASAGQVDRGVLQLVREQRARRRVVLLSNATDRLDADLARLGVEDEVDAVYATYRIGVAKPDRAVYEHVAADLGLPTSACAFVDDSPRHVAGAEAAGMVAHLFTGAADLRVFLDTLDA
ncbi:HAD-IA family hydrolase [Quadrisphaera oryzae]|uniref:HAD-IA family hydrolase n=1 Tax=Quadrisphaera TaxID=317661 RepID=UPI0016468DF7|nr:HAD-IA family hydrolase [Quadrisphaera sp. RL12-1S]